MWNCDQHLAEDEPIASLQTAMLQRNKQEQDITATRNKHRERLVALAAGGQAKQYLGKFLTVDQVYMMDERRLNIPLIDTAGRNSDNYDKAK